MRQVMIAFAIVAVLSVMGCHRSTQGLSQREAPGSEFSSFLFAYGEGSGEPQRPALSLPARVAVAQIGEVGPDPRMLEVLRAQPALFARVDGMPGGNRPSPGYRHADYTAQQQQRDTVEHLGRMERITRDLGAEYLFLYGGTIDSGNGATPLGVLDLTIVGMYLVPSRKVNATARASGALIDLKAHRPVAVVSSDASAKALATNVEDSTREQDLVERTRRQVVEKLAGELIARCRAQYVRAR